jgi:diaminopimelate decarboxylase
VSLRVNPDVNPLTHPYISTGLKGNKFGIAHKDACAPTSAAAPAGLRVVGIDCHIGSQITQVRPTSTRWTACWTWCGDRGGRHAARAHRLRRRPGHRLQRASSRRRPTRCGSACFARWTRAAIGDRQLHDRAGPLAGRQRRPVPDRGAVPQAGEQKNFCIIDAAMNDLPRPGDVRGLPPDRAAAGAAAQPQLRRGRPGVRERRLDRPRPQLAVQPGDLLAVLSAGATA